MFKCLLPFMSRNYPEQRVVAAAVISEFINLCTGDLTSLAVWLGWLGGWVAVWLGWLCG